MIQKEQFKSLRSELDENLKALEVPRYIWHCSELLKFTLTIIANFLPLKDPRKRLAAKSWELTKEIYG